MNSHFSFLHRHALAATLLAGLAVAQVPIGAAATAAVPNDDRAIAHALNRLAFGARPGDVERIKRIGLSKWMEQQLEPQKIDDGEVMSRLARLATINLDSETIARDYFLPARQAQRQRQLQQQGQQSQPGAGRNPEMMAPAQRPDMNPEMRRERQIIMELAEAKILRAVYSERQLEEVLVDFWFNHFNVFARKGQTGIYVGEHEREAIRPHVLGRFRDLLGATAKSPAMLFYLDNWMSSDPSATLPRGARQVPAGLRQRRGLNENYARELLELHTLGVDGGYTQQDVVEVARAFTGWSIGRPEQPGFRFAPFLHDRGEKKVLGQVIRAGGGIEDGELVLDIIASHPSTAKHIGRKLAQRLVSDAPPASLVDRAANRFTETKGDLREVVRTIVTSPEFFARQAYRAKVKTPFEFVVSALRATDITPPNAAPLVRALGTMGMPLYLCQPPTGYDETAQTWVSSGALVNRMNFAVELTNNRRSGASTLESDVTTVRDRLIRDALMGDVSASTRATIAKATTSAQVVALVIGSPEFQRQ